MDCSSDSGMGILEQLSDWDEEEGVQVRRPRRYRARVDRLNTWSDFEFTYRFRLNKEAFQTLLNLIQAFLSVKSARYYGTPHLHQLLLTLRFFALGTMLVTVADYVGVEIATACRIDDVSKAIAQLYPQFVHIANFNTAAFFRIAGFPRVHGVIDGTHILIQSPNAAVGEEFRHRKGYFSLNVQAVCNADLVFQNVVARWPGSSHDATIFSHSELKAQCETGTLENRWLLGDSAYPCSPYLLTPLLNPRNRNEQLYNEAHIRTRNTIERCFCVWKRGFPILALKIRLSQRKTQQVIIPAAVLHNICRQVNIQDIEAEVAIPDGDLEIQDQDGLHNNENINVCQNINFFNLLFVFKKNFFNQ